jgi:hypothetical protein
LDVHERAMHVFAGRHEQICPHASAGRGAIVVAAVVRVEGASLRSRKVISILGEEGAALI